MGMIMFNFTTCGDAQFIQTATKELKKKKRGDQESVKDR